ncbi:MAG: hypothetical protein JWL94_738 [Microbacteriaceae bacterium]|jgi:hypothetical protein|nr:hypothetical protein [Microbacteriaceae bacterium]
MSDRNDDAVPPAGVPYNPPSGSFEGTGAAEADASRTGDYAQPGAGGYAQPGAGGYAQPGAGGYAQPGAGGYAQPGPPGSPKTLSLIGTIVGVVGLLGFWVVFLPIIGSIFGLFLPVAAVVLGFLGKKKEGLQAKPLWLTALITGFVGIAIAIIALVLWIVLFTTSNPMGGPNGY